MKGKFLLLNLIEVEYCKLIFRYKTLFALIFIFPINIGVAIAQTIKSNVSFPSPTAAGLGKYAEYPVSLYSGQININVPLLEINSGKLTLPISLSYNGSGNKPSDIPGWVGLGWSLNAGGVITRVVKNLPDDLNPFGYYYDRSSFNYQLSLFAPETNYCHEAIGRRHDLEPDIFLFNFDGHSGKFHFDNNGVPRIESAEKLKIEFTEGGFSHHVQGFFDSFKITTLDGTKYYFEQKEWSLSGLNISVSGENHVSAWYLTKVQSLTGEEITFKYTQPEEKYRFQERTSENVVFVAGTAGFNSSGITSTFSIDEVVYLDEINFQNGKLKFPKSKREEIYFKPTIYNHITAEEKKLDNIELYDKDNNFVKKWKFAYVYNGGRLKIDSIKEMITESDQNQTYRFEYNPERLPTSSVTGSNAYDSNAIDHWGYYNGANNYGRLPIFHIQAYNAFVGSANRTPNPLFMEAEMLTKIYYPTGGYAKFDFEPHTYTSQISGPLEPEYEWIGPYSFFYEVGIFDVDPTTVEFTLNEPSVVQTTRSAINIGPNRDWLPSGSESLTYTLPAGTHTLASIFRTYELLFNGNSDVQTAAGSIRIRKKVGAYANIGGGLRIKSVETFDGKDLVKKEYDYTSRPGYSSGILSGYPNYYRLLNTIYINLQGYMISSNGVDEVPYGPTVSYGMVTEKFNNNSKIAHYFTTFSDFPDLEGIPYSPMEYTFRHPTSFSDMRGLEKRQELFSSTGLKVKEIQNTYVAHPDGQIHIPAIDNKIVFIGSTAPNSSSGDEAYSMSKYTIPSRFVYKESSKEILYDPFGAESVVTQTNYNYENPQHFRVTKVVSTNSKGETLQKKFSYPGDMVSLNRDPNGVYIGMVGQNSIEPIIEEVQLKSSVQMSMLRTNYYQPFAGIFLPRTIESQLKITDPIVTQAVYHAYDLKGNLLSFSRNDGPKTNYIWSYGGQYPVAEIKNTEYSAIENIKGAGTLSSFSQSYPDKTAVDAFVASLRTGLQDAQIASYAYKPLIGLTSQTDIKGTTTFYEYDILQRLKRVKDQNGNIVKSYDYHYKP